MNDLEQIRAWRSAAPNRALVLHGRDGLAGVTLVAFSGLTRLEASYNAPAEAAAALSAGAVDWHRRVSVDGAEASDATRLRFTGDSLQGATTRGLHPSGRQRSEERA